MRTPRLLSMPTTEVQGALVQRVDVGGRQVMDGVEKEGGQGGHSDVLTTPGTVIMHDILQVWVSDGWSRLCLIFILRITLEAYERS